MSDEKYLSIRGTLIAVTDGHDGLLYYFEKESGEFLDIHISENVELEDVPINQLGTLKLDKELRDEKYTIFDCDDNFIPDPVDDVPFASGEKIKKHIGLFRQVDESVSDESINDFYLPQIQENAKAVEEFYKKYADHVWDIRVEGFVMRGDANTHPPYYAKSDIDRYMEEHDMGDFEPNYFHVQGGVSGGYCGQGSIGGYRSVTYLGMSCGEKTMIHELGHNFGWHHANTQYEDEPTSVEYGDVLSIMGAGSERVLKLNSEELHRLGLETEREYIEINETQQVYISPVEVGPETLRDGEFQTAVIKKGRNNPLYVSLQKTYPSTNGTRSRYEKRLFVYEGTRDRHSIRWLPDMQVGDTKEFKSGVRIEFVDWVNESARVNIYYDKDDLTPDNLPDLPEFPIIPNSVEMTDLHSGSWYNPIYDGEGFDIHVKNGRAVLYWYTYNRVGTCTRFYWGSGKIIGNSVIFDMKTSRNGSWGFPSDRIVEEAGRFQLTFTGPNSGRFDFFTKEHGRGRIDIVPVKLSGGDPQSGCYYQPSRDGEGFTLHFYETVNGVKKCMAFFYSYGNPPFDELGNPGNLKQRWYTCTGKEISEGVYNLNVREARENSWMEERDDSNVTDCGTMTLRIVDDNNLSIDYNINATRINDEGTFEVTRLF